MKKNLLIFPFIGLLALATISCNKQDGNAIDVEDKPVIENPYTEEPKMFEDCTHSCFITYDGDSAYYALNPGRRGFLDVNIGDTGKYDIDFGNDVKVYYNEEELALQNGKITLLLERGEVRFEIYNNNSLPKMANVTFELSSDTNNITVKDSYYVHIKNDTDQKKVVFNGDVTLEVMRHDYEANSVLECPYNDYYLKITNNKIEPQTSDLSFENIDTHQLNESLSLSISNNLRTKCFSIDVKEAGYYKLVRNKVYSYDIFGAVAASGVICGIEQSSAYYFPKGKVYFGAYNDEEESGTVTITRMNEIGELYINGNLYDGHTFINRGDSVEIEYIKNGVSAISEISVKGEGNIEQKDDKIIYTSKMTDWIDKDVFVYLDNEWEPNFVHASIHLKDEPTITTESYTYNGERGVLVSVNCSGYSLVDYISFDAMIKYPNVGFTPLLTSSHDGDYSNLCGYCVHLLGKGKYFFPVNQQLFQKYGAVFYLKAKHQTRALDGSSYYSRITQLDTVKIVTK